MCEPERDVGEEDEEPGGQDQVLHVGHRPRGEGGHRVHHRQESKHSHNEVGILTSSILKVMDSFDKMMSHFSSYSYEAYINFVAALDNKGSMGSNVFKA